MYFSVKGSEVQLPQSLLTYAAGGGWHYNQSFTRLAQLFHIAERRLPQPIIRMPPRYGCHRIYVNGPIMP